MKIEKGKLPTKMAKMKINKGLLTQYVLVYLSNKRKAKAKTKTRGEVEKTTAKMYKQKGTGRARHGSYAAPIFVGGGVAFGPTGTQNYTKKLSKEQTRQAVISALISKKNLYSISDIGKLKSTKEAATALKELAGRNLIVLGSNELKQAKYLRNINQIKVTAANNINAYELVACKNLLFTESSLEEIEKKYVS